MAAIDECLNALSYLKAQRADKETWRIALPFWPWQKKSAELELDEFLNSLRQRYFCALCCVDLDADRISVREVKSADHFSAFSQELDEGGWALMFFESRGSIDGLSQRISGCPVFPGGHRKAAALLEIFGAKIVVWSYYDNAEWLLCSAPM